MDREKTLLYTAVILAAFTEPLAFYAALQQDLPSRARLIADDIACRQRSAECLAAYMHKSELACEKHGI